MLDLTKLNLMNAAGECKTLERVEALCKTPVTEICIGSITLHPREINDGNTFWTARDGAYSLNSLGLPNMGLEKFLTILPAIAKICRNHGKRIRVSIAGFSPEDYYLLMVAIALYVDVIEFNLGCPNVWSTDGQKPIASFSIEAMDAIFKSALTWRNQHGYGIRPKFAAKLSPYSDPGQFERTVQFFKAAEAVDEIVTSNTFPNGFGIEDGRAAITPGGGFAGVSGGAMRGIALGQAKKLHDELAPCGFTVTLVGGISHGEHIVDAMRLGLYSVQVGTHWMKNGDGVFSRLLQEVADHPEVDFV